MQKTLSNKKLINTRPLTKNEKMLITVLSIVILIWSSNRFIFQPQAEKLTDLAIAKSDYEIRIIDINNALKSEEQINRDWDLLHKERDQILSKYFPTLDQAQIIYLLNDLTKEDSFDASDLSFSRPSNEQLGQVDVRKMEVSIPFSGDYEGIIDVINSFGASPRRILVNNLTLDKKDNNELTGSMALKIYSLEGIAETNPDVIYVDTASNSSDNPPFKPYGDFSNEESPLSSGGEEYISTEEDLIDFSPDRKDGMRRQMLHDFDDLSYIFIPSNPRVKGNVTPSTIKKSGKYSMRLEYNILALEEENRAYIDISSPNNDIKVVPDSIGTWVYSYGYSPGSLGMILKTQSGEKVDIGMVDGVTWMGWSYIETSLPSDLKLYPLKLEKLYYELPHDRDDFGVLLFDKMEAFYRTNEETTDNTKELPTYIFYVVEPGDNVSRISEAIYGNGNYKNEIMELNDIKPGDTLSVGKVLVLKRH